MVFIWIIIAFSPPPLIPLDIEIEKYWSRKNEPLILWLGIIFEYKINK